MDEFLRRQPRLTQFQVSLLGLFASDLRPMDAALRLHVSPSYVHNQTQTIKAELGARTIPACVMRAHAMGLLSHPTGSDHVVLALAA